MQESASFQSNPRQQLILVISSPLRMNGNQLVKSATVETAWNQSPNIQMVMKILLHLCGFQHLKKTKKTFYLIVFIYFTTCKYFRALSVNKHYMLQKDSVNTSIYSCRGLNWVNAVVAFLIMCPRRHNITGQRHVGEVPTGQQGSAGHNVDSPQRTTNRLLRCWGQELSAKAAKVKGH